MARNGSGTYTRVNTFTSGNAITAAGHNQNWADLETEMTNSVAADGQTSLTGPLKAANGTAAAPGITFAADADSGIYRIGTNNVGMAVNGAKVLDVATTGLSITGTLTSSGAVNVTSGGLTVTAGGLTVTAGAVSLPAGAIGSAAIADGAITLAKVADSSAESRLLGRGEGSGAGAFEELTLGGGLSLSGTTLSSVQPVDGSLVNSAIAEYAGTTAISAAIPIDDTIPQIGEGYEIISTSYTMASTTNKLRIRFNGFFSGSTSQAVAVAAVFLNSNADALAASSSTLTTSNLTQPITLEHEFTPGTTSALTISIRIGVLSGKSVSMNSLSTSRIFGGTAKSTLLLEEIKAS